MWRIRYLIGRYAPEWLLRRLCIIKPFKPCAVQFDEIRMTEILLRDCAIVWSPYTTGPVDLGYDMQGNLVGVRIWDPVLKRGL